MHKEPRLVSPGATRDTVPFTRTMVSISVNHFRAKFAQNSHPEQIHMCAGMWL